MRKKREEHGMRYTPTYKVWADMVQRCTNPNRAQYADWGGRGIKVCERWRNSFLAFYHDMGDRPEGMSIDRIDVDGNYEPGNCRWADTYEQAQNKGLMKANKTGIPGVWWYAERGVYKACINIQGKLRHLGYTPDFFEACCLRKSAEAIRNLV